MFYLLSYTTYCIQNLCSISDISSICSTVCHFISRLVFPLLKVAMCGTKRRWIGQSLVKVFVNPWNWAPGQSGWCHVRVAKLVLFQVNKLLWYYDAYIWMFLGRQSFPYLFNVSFVGRCYMFVLFCAFPLCSDTAMVVHVFVFHFFSFASFLLYLASSVFPYFAVSRAISCCSLMQM